MKITKIELDNFAQFATALDGVSHLEIDFTKSENRICLIIGPNGSGKTSLLSALQPFATVGSLDVRNSQDLILKDKEGHKFLDIEYNGDLYQIHHFYIPVKGKNHTVKSYLTLNGEELNPNGNQRSFKELMLDKFKIDQDYLKLIRLGSNVKSMIDLSSTDRKLFMANLMSDIDAYLKLHDKVNGDLKQIKLIISHSADRLGKLNIESEEKINKQIKDLKKDISDCEETISNANKDIGGYDLTIRSIGMSVEAISDRITEIRPKYRKVKGVDISDEALHKLEKAIEKETKDIARFEENIRTLKSNIESLQQESHHLRDKISMLESRQNEYDRRMEGVKVYQDNIKSYEDKIEECESIIKDFVPAFTKAELENFIVTLRGCQDILNRVYAYGDKPMKIVISLMREGKSVDAYITQFEMQDPDTHKTDRKVRKFVNDLSETYGFGLGYDYPCQDKTICNRCKAHNMYEHVSSIFREKLISDDDGDMIEFVKSINRALKEVIGRITDCKDFIERLPKKFKEKFLTENVYNKFEKLEPIYDVVRYNALLTRTVSYYNIGEYTKRINEFKATTQALIDGTFIDIKSINKEHSESKARMKIIKDTIKDYENKLRAYEEDLFECTKYKEDDESAYTLLLNSREIINEFEDLNHKREDLKDAIKLRTKANETIIKKSKEVSVLNEKLIDCSARRKEYIEINDELNEYAKEQKSLIYVKKGLSPKEGIPLHFLNLYLGKVRDMANDLLNVVYDGNLYIESFNITANEFSIPYVTKGKHLKDVSYASQGELSFISVALSFALSYQIMCDYNIMLLDEIDGPLDQNNRSKFIQIMERQMNAIGTEQNFIITHNDVFLGYPIDVIDMGFTHNITSRYYYANEIPVITDKEL